MGSQITNAFGLWHFDLRCFRGATLLIRAICRFGLRQSANLLYDGRFCDRLLPLAFRVRRGFGLDGFLAAALQFFARLALLLRSTRDVRADQSTCLFGLVLRLRRLDLA
jgi:hypothetical protein